MGKSIDLSQPLSDEDRRWLEERGDYAAIAVADATHGAPEPREAKADEPSEPEDAPVPLVAEPVAEPNAGDDGVTEPSDSSEDADDDVPPYEEWTADALRDECDARGLAKSGSKADLIDRLVADDEGE